MARRRRAGWRYGAWHDGPDPLAPPYDARRAVDEIGDRLLRGDSVRDALRSLLRRGMDGRRGLDELQREVRRRRREVRERGRLDGTLEEARRLLDTAIGQERAALFPDPSDDARFREATLDALPDGTSRAIQELSSYDWRSPEARTTFAALQDLLRREVLDRQFQGLKQALAGGTPEERAAAMQRTKDMLADLNAMLERDARGEHTQQDFDAFLARHGDLVPGDPQTLEELVDELARRAAAAQRLMASLTPEQRAELAALMEQALGDLDLAAQMDRLSGALRDRRPDLDWTGRQRMTGDEPLGVGDATTALQELADLESVESALGSSDAAAGLDAIDEEAVRRALGRRAVDDLEALRALERELSEQGFLDTDGGRLDLTPKAVRRLAQSALRHVFGDLVTSGRGRYDVSLAGAAGEVTGATRPWQFGDEQPLDVVRTLGNAVRRNAVRGNAIHGDGPAGVRLALTADDFEVVETERRTQAAVCLLVDLSYSMVLRDTLGAAKATALALYGLVSGSFPQDAISVIGFSSYARELRPEELPTLHADYVQGTNLQHALMLAGRFLDRHAHAEPVVLVVTDGEPTAHLDADGTASFMWPPTQETLVATLAEVDRMTRRAATLNVFLLDDDPRLASFVHEVARRNGGRVLEPDPARLGRYVVEDYLQRRCGLRGSRTPRGGRRAG